MFFYSLYISDNRVEVHFLNVYLCLDSISISIYLSCRVYNGENTSKNDIITSFDRGRFQET